MKKQNDTMLNMFRWINLAMLYVIWAAIVVGT